MASGSILIISAMFADKLIVLQRLSSISDFSDLVATIQAMKSINPLQVALVVSFVHGG